MTTNPERRSAIRSGATARDQRFEHFVDSVEDYAIYALDTQGRVQTWNLGAQRMKGYTTEEILGQHFSRFYEAEARQCGKPEEVLRMVAEGGHFAEEGWRLRKDGSRFWAHVTLRRLIDRNGVLQGFSKVTRDLTESKRGKERDLLLREVHHRVKNSLQAVSSLLSLEMGHLADPAISNMVHRTQDRIRMMSAIHETLYQRNDFGQIEFKAFLVSFVPTLIASHSPHPASISLTIDGTELRLPVELAMPCSLIANEIITNILKHAFPAGRPGKITIELAHDQPGASATICISDDGAGLKEDSHLGHSSKLGMQLVQLLTAQIDGQLTIRRISPTWFGLRFPLPA